MPKSQPDNVPEIKHGSSESCVVADSNVVYFSLSPAHLQLVIRWSQSAAVPVSEQLSRAPFYYQQAANRFITSCSVVVISCCLVSIKSWSFLWLNVDLEDQTASCSLCTLSPKAVLLSAACQHVFHYSDVKSYLMLMFCCSCKCHICGTPLKHLFVVASFVMSEFLCTQTSLGSSENFFIYTLSCNKAIKHI